MDGFIEIVRVFQKIRRLAESLRDDGVDDGDGAGAGIRGAHHTEFEFVAGKGKGGGPVPVRGVFVDVRQGGNAGPENAALNVAVRAAGLHQLADHILQLFSQKDGHNGRGRFIRAQPQVIAHIGGRLPQQFRVGIDRLEDTGQDQQELDIALGRGPGLQQVDPVVR